MGQLLSAINRDLDSDVIQDMLNRIRPAVQEYSLDLEACSSKGPRTILDDLDALLKVSTTTGNNFV